MPTYVLLTTLTPEGRQTLHRNPDRMEEVNDEMARFGVQVIGLLISVPAIIVMSLSTDRTVLAVALFINGVASWFYYSNLWTSTFEVVDPAARATAIGLLNVIAGVFGAWLSPFVGNLYESGKITSLGTAFLGTAALAGLSAMLLLVIILFTLRRDFKGPSK